MAFNLIPFNRFYGLGRRAVTIDAPQAIPLSHKVSIGAREITFPTIDSPEIKPPTPVSIAATIARICFRCIVFFLFE
jgi:hypothetical protein